MVFCTTEKEDTEYLTFMSVSTGKDLASFTREDLECGYSYNISLVGDTLYTLDRKGNLWGGRLETGAEREMLIECGGRFEPIGMCAVGDWLWFLNDDDGACYRVMRTGRIMSGTPVGPIWDYKSFRQEKTDGDWSYYEYPEFIRINGYNGSAEEVAIPEELGGKPVRVVSWWAYNHEGKNVRVLTIPDSVVVIGAIEDRNIEVLNVPASVKHLLSRGWHYTFTIHDGGTLNYAGTREAWQALCDYSAQLHDSATDTSGTEGLRVLCAEGKWGITVTVRADGASWEVTTDDNTVLSVFKMSRRITTSTLDADWNRIGEYVYSVNYRRADQQKGEYWAVSLNGADLTDAFDEAQVKEGDRIELTLKVRE